MPDAAERMKKAGWISHFIPNGNDLTIAWTEKGKNASEILAALYVELTPDHHQMPSETLNCVVVLCRIAQSDEKTA